MISPYDIEIISNKPEYKPVTDQIKKELEDLTKEKGVEFISFTNNKSKLFMHEGKIKGFCNVHFIRGVPTLEIGILNEFRGQGLGPAVLMKLKNALFEETPGGGYPLVQVLINKYNGPAKRAAEKSGFYMVDENEELNVQNKEDTYYTFVARNYRMQNDRSKGSRR